jgi:Glycosyltransferase family 87
VFGGSGLVKVITIAAVAVFFGYYVSQHPMDFRVYHYGARGVLDGTRPVYGPTSGLGWPMHYRYPPLFLLLFAPLAMMPLGLAAALWVVAKIGVLIWLLVAFRKRGMKPTTAYVVPALFILPYLIEEFRYGNAQFFVIALTIAGLLTLREKPLLSGATLGLAISIKVWPLFFLPYLAVRRDWKPIGCTLAFVAALALLPSFYFGVPGNLNLLAQWFAQESHTQLSESEIWFQNQSLRGVLMRYLTVIDYSHVPDSNYPQISIASLNPGTVRLLWLVIAGAIYSSFLVAAYRRKDDNGWLDPGLAFCLLALLEPFTQKYALALLLWPAIAAAGLMKKPQLRILVYSATVLVLIQPLAPGASAQRLLQVLGLDFAATLLLTITLFVAQRHNYELFR